MNELVIINSKGVDVTTSLKVAEIFSKDHDKVCRDIENLSCSDEFNTANFGVISYWDSMNRERRAYEMTKDGFSFLVMGFTGDEAGQFKERFLREFNKREALLKNDDYIIHRALEISRKKIDDLQQLAEAQSKQIQRLAPKAELMDQIMDDNTRIDIGQAAKVLGLPYGRNTLFLKLRESGIFFKSRNEPLQEYVDRGYFILREKRIEPENGTPFLVLKVLVTQKGINFLARILGVVATQTKMALIQ